jgi:hypothetical protein
VTKEQIVGLAVRLFAVFLVIYVVRHASSLIPLLSESSKYRVGAAYLTLIVLFPIVAAILLWRLPLTVAATLIPGVNTKKRPRPINSTDMERVAFTILGVWVFATAIPDVVYWTTFVYLLNNASAGKPIFAPEDLSNIVATAVELAIGLWLLLGTRGIIDFLRRLRGERI